MAVGKPFSNKPLWDQWVSERPQVIQDLCRRFPGDRLYRIKSAGNRGTIYSYNEDGTLTLEVTGEFNRVLFSRRVFGVPADDLEECDLPAPGEDLGDTAQEAGYDEDDIQNILIPKIREDIARGKQC